MRKWITPALALVLTLTLAACGGTGGTGGDAGNGGNTTAPPGSSAPAPSGETPKGNDTEFTIFVNGEKDWTPYPGKSGVTFSVSDEKVISVRDDGSKVEFTGKQVGESTITATLDGVESHALVRVRAQEAEDEAPTVTYNPPPEYYIELSYVTDSADRTRKETYCKIGSEYAHRDDNEIAGMLLFQADYFDLAGQRYYCMTNGVSDDDDNIPDWILMTDPDTAAPDFPDWGPHDAARPLAQYFDIVDEAKAMGMTGLTNNFLRYENILGRKCAVFEIAQGDLLNLWVDLDTGCTLKRVDVNYHIDDWECVTFKLDNLAWNDKLKP